MSQIGFISLIIFLVITLLLIEFLLIKNGLRLCKDNNAIGIVLLFIALNFLGLIIGIAIIYNLKNKN